MEEGRRWIGKVKSCGPHWDGRGTLKQWSPNCDPLISILNTGKQTLMEELTTACLFIRDLCTHWMVHSRDTGAWNQPLQLWPVLSEYWWSTLRWLEECHSAWVLCPRGTTNWYGTGILDLYIWIQYIQLIYMNLYTHTYMVYVYLMVMHSCMWRSEVNVVVVLNSSLLCE